MKIRYMIDCILVNEGDASSYQPVGVWVQGPGLGLDVEMFYIDKDDPAVEARRDAALWVINRLVENDIAVLPDDFLDFHRQSRSPYDGTFLNIITTEEYGSIVECGKRVLQQIQNKE